MVEFTSFDTWPFDLLTIPNFQFRNDSLEGARVYFFQVQNKPNNNIQTKYASEK